MGANKVCDGDPLLVHCVEVLDVVVKEVVRAGGETYAVEPHIKILDWLWSVLSLGDEVSGHGGGERRYI